MDAATDFWSVRYANQRSINQPGVNLPLSPIYPVSLEAGNDA